MRRLVIITAVFLFTLSASAGEEVIRRGTAIPADAAVVPMPKVLADPAAYATKPVVTEGVIERSCTNKGCWMQLAPAAGEKGMRVTFKDYGFFIPLDAKGLQARVEGVTKSRTLSKKEVDHLERDGAKLAREADGTVREVSFVASGVELRK